MLEVTSFEFENMIYSSVEFYWHGGFSLDRTVKYGKEILNLELVCQTLIVDQIESKIIQQFLWWSPHLYQNIQNLSFHVDILQIKNLILLF
jgi:hypothetical protein